MTSSLATKRGQAPTYSPRTLETSRRRLEAFLIGVAQSSSPLRPSRSSVADLGDSPLKARIYRRGGSEQVIEKLENASLGGETREKNTERSEDSFNRLPDDLIQLIMEQLPPSAHHIHTVSLVSHRFYNIAQSPTLWAKLYLDTAGWRMSVDAIRMGYAVDQPPMGHWEGDLWLPSESISGMNSDRGKRAVTSPLSSTETSSARSGIPIHFPTLYRSRSTLSQMIRNPQPTYRVDSKSLPTHTDSVYCIRALGQWLFTGSRDRSIGIWRLSKSDEFGKLPIEPLQLVKRLPSAHAGSILCLSISLNDQGIGTMVSGSSDKAVKVWKVDMNPGGLGDISEPSVELQETLQGHNAGVLDVLLTANHIVSASKDSTIRIYNRSTLALRRVIAVHTQSVNSLAAGSDVKTFASASADESWRLWDLESGREIGRSQDMAKSSKLACIAFCGDWLVTGDVSRNVNIYNTKTGDLIRTCTGHTDLIRTVDIDADEGLVYSGSYDGAVRIWELHTGALIRKFIPNHANSSTSAAIAPENQARCIFDVRSTTNRLYIAKQNGSIEIVTLVTGLPYTHIMTGA